VVSVGCKLWLGSQDDPGSAIRSLGFMGPLFAVALQCATSITPVGSSVIPVINGMLFPLLLAMGLNMAAGLAVGIGMYYVWRRGERTFQLQERLRALPPWARRFARSDLPSLIVMRMLPWAGANMANFMAGADRVSLRVHVVGVLIGSLPGSIIYALLGAGIISL
jgi:uncharacterized membrane protein YdjX (TVP38/TMEM64 family)